VTGIGASAGANDVASVPPAPLGSAAMPDAPGAPPVDVRDPRVAAAVRRYWRANVRIMAALLAVWAIAGLGCGVLFADVLNQFRLGGFPLGFWFAQQGSILVFVLLVLAYAVLMNRLDARHHAELERIRRAAATGAPP
jgi:putative solute:sodium symporter small subunit